MKLYKAILGGNIPVHIGSAIVNLDAGHSNTLVMGDSVDTRNSIIHNVIQELNATYDIMGMQVTYADFTGKAVYTKELDQYSDLLLRFDCTTAKGLTQLLSWLDGEYNHRQKLCEEAGVESINQIDEVHIPNQILILIGATRETFSEDYLQRILESSDLYGFRVIQSSPIEFEYNSITYSKFDNIVILRDKQWNIHIAGESPIVVKGLLS